jgi:hypothetical protein
VAGARIDDEDNARSRTIFPWKDTAATRPRGIVFSAGSSENILSMVSKKHLIKVMSRY